MPAQPQIYLTMDWHLRHANIIKYENRPEDYERQIRNGLRIIKPEDMLIHMGDMYLGPASQFDEVMQEIANDNPGYAQCTKILTRGNHDSLSASRYRKAGYILMDSITIQGVYISHHGVITLPSDATCQLFGHYHSNQAPEVLVTNGKRLSIEELSYGLITLTKAVQGITRKDKEKLSDENRHKEEPVQ